ncbi:hypothetical protein D3C85_705810 [compost metagenome]
MKSKFTLKGFIFPIIAISLIAGSLLIINNNFPINFQQLRWVDSFIVLLIILTLVWLIVFEINKKMIVIKIKDNTITKQSLFNELSKANFEEFEGYTTAIESTRIGSFEELSILKNGKKTITISEKYHLNYHELKKIINKKLKYLGGAQKTYH